MLQPANASSAASPALIGCQPCPAVASAHRVTNPVEHAVIERLDSVTTSRRVMMSRVASKKAAPSGRSATHRRPSCPGASMISTPAKPTATALRRRHPTRSPSAHGAAAVSMSGPAKVRATASASGRYCRPVMNREHRRDERHGPQQLSGQVRHPQQGADRRPGR